MKTKHYFSLSIILILFIIGCSTNINHDKQLNGKDPENDAKQIMSSPQEWIGAHPESYDLESFIRYQKMIIDPLTAYHNVYGKMPNTLTEFFNSDFCFIHPKEVSTGLKFEESETLDLNHPEHLFYKFIDEDSAELSFILTTMTGEKYIHKQVWNKERFWSFFPRDAYGKDEKEWLDKINQKPPTTNKRGKMMLDEFRSIFAWAIVEYFNDHNAFPNDLHSLFRDKWGELRAEPWKNFQYDDPSRKLPNKIFGFDKNQNYYYCHHLWEDGSTEYALKLPANFIEQTDHPLNVKSIERTIINGKIAHSEGDIDSLNIEFFADVETLRNL